MGGKGYFSPGQPHGDGVEGGGNGGAVSALRATKIYKRLAPVCDGFCCYLRESPKRNSCSCYK